MTTTTFRRARSGTKLLMKCHSCRQECQPKDGDWHDSESGQIFLCRGCETQSHVGRPSPRQSLLSPAFSGNKASNL